MLYSPFEAFEHSAAALTNDPDGSGKMYQLTVGVPEELELLAHPDASRATAVARARMAAGRRANEDRPVALSPEPG
jgi:hypothetical protein